MNNITVAGRLPPWVSTTLWVVNWAVCSVMIRLPVWQPLGLSGEDSTANNTRGLTEKGRYVSVVSARRRSNTAQAKTVQEQPVYYTAIILELYCKIIYRTDPRFAPSQWETVLLCNDVSHWLGASLESILNLCVMSRLQPVNKHTWHPVALSESCLLVCDGEKGKVTPPQTCCWHVFIMASDMAITGMDIKLIPYTSYV